LLKRLRTLEIAENSNAHKPWTNFELKWIKDNYHNTTARELAIDLKRSVGTIQTQVKILKLKKL
jgi:hypothetical protein